MSKTEVHVELLLGRRVFALNGRSIGRIEEIRAEIDTRHSCFVTEFLVGKYAFLERLSALSIGRAILQTLGARHEEGWRIPWDMLDLTDVERPRLLCKVNELRVLKEEE
jgi:sporulation protein YlmC with PRC-barrel domain